MTLPVIHLKGRESIWHGASVVNMCAARWVMLKIAVDAAGLAEAGLAERIADTPTNAPPFGKSVP